MTRVNGLKTSRILTEIYARDDPDNTATYRDLDQLTLEYKQIPHLHSKLYLNERYGIVISMKVDMHPAPKPDILQLFGQAQHTWKSTCITVILEAEAVYMMESVIRFIDSTDDLIIQC